MSRLLSLNPIRFGDRIVEVFIFLHIPKAVDVNIGTLDPLALGLRGFNRCDRVLGRSLPWLALSMGRTTVRDMTLLMALLMTLLMGLLMALLGGLLMALMLRRLQTIDDIGGDGHKARSAEGVISGGSARSGWSPR